jgi:CheY-like chemotaxis protein
VQKKPILIVDDDKDIQASIKMILELKGYGVVSASNGKEALTYIQDINPPALILLDLMMPAMDGFEFLKKLETDYKALAVPVIVMSAARNKATEVKNYTTLLKPFDIDYLLTLVERHVAHV